MAGDWESSRVRASTYPAPYCTGAQVTMPRGQEVRRCDLHRTPHTDVVSRRARTQAPSLHVLHDSTLVASARGCAHNGRGGSSGYCAPRAAMFALGPCWWVQYARVTGATLLPTPGCQAFSLFLDTALLPYLFSLTWQDAAGAAKGSQDRYRRQKVLGGVTVNTACGPLQPDFAEYLKEMLITDTCSLCYFRY